MVRRSGYRFADKNMRHSTNLEPIRFNLIRYGSNGRQTWFSPRPSSKAPSSSTSIRTGTAVRTQRLGSMLSFLLKYVRVEATHKTACGLEMHFHPTTLKDAWLIDLQPARDERGFFARTFCLHEFSAHGLETSFPQHSISVSPRRGTLRGMHFQREPHAEVKLVRCMKGEIWDVIIDLRAELADILPLAKLRTFRGEPTPVVHPQGVRARLSNTYGRRRGELSDLRRSTFPKPRTGSDTMIRPFRSSGLFRLP